MYEDALVLDLSGLGDFSRAFKRRFFRVGPAEEVLAFFIFFLVGSGTNAPGVKSESESTSVVYIAAI